jgi:hypothetical protein
MEPFAYIFLGLIVVVIISIASGVFGPWKKLKSIYGFMGDPQAYKTGEKYILQLLILGKSQYKGIVRMTITSQGLYLQPVFIFKLGHPPLFIPWNEITKLGEDDYPSGSRTTTGLVTANLAKKGLQFQGVRIDLQFQRLPNMKVVMDETAGDIVDRKKREFGF